MSLDLNLGAAAVVKTVPLITGLIYNILILNTEIPTCQFEFEFFGVMSNQDG